MFHLNEFFREKKWWLKLVAIAMFIFAGCTDKFVEPVQLYHSYFPSNPGHYVIYNVDSTFFDDFTGEGRNFQYQVKERIHSRFTDSEGKESIRIERFRRQTSAHTWILKDIWHARIEQARALKYKENIAFIKLIFPPNAGTRWNGNALNHLPEMTYRITEVHQPATLSNGLRFDSTLTVMQNNFVTLINEDIRWEKYALHIGLIERSYRNIRKNVAGNITSGVKYTYTLLEYGNDAI